MPPGRPAAPSPRPSEASPARAADPDQDLAAALHEVSNALTVLLGWVDSARAATDPESVATALDVVASRASHARDIARRAIGGANAPAAPVPARDLIADAALALSVEARRAGVQLAVEVAPEVAAQKLPSGPALHQILTNLLLNALAFSPAGAAVRLTASAASPDRVLVQVDDEGPGIAPHLREHLLEAGVTSRRGGAGIGLRHSAELAAGAGGELRLADAARGARFELFWPLVAQAPAEPGAGRDGAASGEFPRAPEERFGAGRLSIEGSRILVVEDDDAVIDLLELALEARGASVVSVRKRADLPAALASGEFDAALLDMSPLLGDVDGAVAELRRSSPGARLVVMSGSVPSAEVGGASVWVRKPFEVREIVDALSPAVRPPAAPSS